MTTAPVPVRSRSLAGLGVQSVPAVIADAGERATYRFLEFFTANIRNKNTRAAYARALLPFLAWCEKHGAGLKTIDPVRIAAISSSCRPRTPNPP